ncbi:MAG: DNA repair exonuclease [Candidatus Parvarchaeota archaeon]|nr:DNA repair exonuclease [Candidatus Parvarchaeota archaeon]MCL5101194.1 DNA repair exonuclease [Candidatus Parvarchaeota archaeon]
MKFIHIGDTHIGAVYKNENRNADVKDAFNQVVDAAIKEKIDFIVHSGDLFNEGNPSLEALLFVTDQLNKLRLAGIKLFIVPGSHDVGMGEEDSVVELFDRNGLLINLNSKRYISNDDDSFKLSGETYKGAFICGVQGKRSNVENDIFKRLSISIDNSAWIKIFIFHHTISALGEQFKDLDTDSLPKGFDYYAAGHWHGHKDGIKYEKGIIQYPGSTEYCDEKEIVDNPNRGYYIIEYDSDGITSIAYNILKTREKDIVGISADNKTAKELYTEMLSKLKTNSGKILVIRISGKLVENRGSINLPEIKKAALEKGYSYVSINTSKLMDRNDEVLEVTETDIGKIETEFLTKKGYNNIGLKLAKLLISETQNNDSPESILKKAEELFEEYDTKRD